jgi:hypothetical protein
MSGWVKANSGTDDEEAKRKKRVAAKGHIIFPALMKEFEERVGRGYFTTMHN